MARINGQVIEFKRLANQILMWIVCAKRPLTTRELQHALAVEVGESVLNEDKIPEIEDMVTVCAGLVTVDEESGIIRLVHYTTQEYFEQTQKSWYPTAEVEITKICLTYLSFSRFESAVCETPSEFEDRLQWNPLYDYAARNWGYHARVVSAEVEYLAKTFFGSEFKVSNSCQAMMAPRDYIGTSRHRPRKMTGLHLAAHFGLMEMMIAMLKDQGCLESQDNGSWTPLFYAVKNEQEAMVKLLLEKGADLESKDAYRARTAISYAASYGFMGIVQLLLEKGAKLESKCNYRRTPLCYAAIEGHSATVKLLLEKGADPVSNYDWDSTLLDYAKHSGHEEVVKLLLDNGADPAPRLLQRKRKRSQ